MQLDTDASLPDDRTRPPVPGRRRGRHVLRGMVAMVLLLVVVFVAGNQFGWRFLRGPAEWALGAMLEREASVGAPFRLHLGRSIRLRAASVAVAGPDWRPDPPLLDLHGVSVALPWTSLWRRPLHLDSVAVAHGSVHAVRLADGRASWSFDPDPAQPPRNECRLPIDVAEVGRVQVRFDDAISDVALDLRVATVRDAQGPAALEVAGDGSWRDEPIRLEVRVPDALGVAETGSARGVRASGSVGSTEWHYAGSVSDVFSLDGLSGDVAVDGGSLSDLAALTGIPLPDTPAYRIDAQIDWRDRLLTVAVRQAEIGSSRLSGQLAYAPGADPGSDPPRLTGRVDAERLRLADLGTNLRADLDRRKASDATKVLSTRPFDIPVLGSLNAAIALDL